MKKIYRQKIDSWYLERWLFLIAGILVLLTSILVLNGVAGFIYFILLIGVLLIIFAFSGFCPMAIILSFLGIKAK